MFKSLAGSLRVGALGLALLAGTASLAAAEDLLVPGAQARPAELGSLMAPIEPLVGGESGSTTSVYQVGSSNSAITSVTGSGSLSLIRQSGDNNRAVQAIQGSGTALLLAQGGTNNQVFQASQGNDNFQMVGVSGHDNDIAYVQVGNQLAGVLDVTNSVNTSVFALQTPQSGHYLMPTGISGLQNKTVVVVPGRMYVLPKK